jgi:hypothetical protein
MGTRVGGLYNLDVTMNRYVALTFISMSTEELWHHRYGHLLAAISHFYPILISFLRKCFGTLDSHRNLLNLTT